MKNIVSIAPGKVILTGEHSVVYGKPALLAAIDLETRATIEGGAGEVLIQAPEIGLDDSFTLDELTTYWRGAHEAWRRYIDLGDEGEWRKYRNDRQLVVLASLGLVYDEFRMCGGMQVVVDSTIPMGSGMGSSASVAAALMGGMGKMVGAGWSKEELYERVMMVEQVVHGRASGADPAAVIEGGLMEFVKNGDDKRFTQFQVEKIKGHFVLIQSGKPVETTGEMVSKVHDQLSVNNFQTKVTIDKIGILSEAVISQLEKNRMGWEWILENERLLEELGVVSEQTQSLIRKIENEGGMAKVCGAGGALGGSGIVLAYHGDREKLMQVLSGLELPHYQVKLGVAGWHIV